VSDAPAVGVNDRLAIEGGPKIRTEPMPKRRALGPSERRMLQEALQFYQERGEDPGYQGHFEKLYTDAFVQSMGGGYADAVSTGTSALYVALAAMQLRPGSEVLVSPITDPGTLGAIILNGLRVKLMDSRPGSYNVGADQLLPRISNDTSAVVIVHAAGQACPDIERMVTIAHAHGLKVLEDCSQAHGARAGGKQVGSFGDIAAFSTMYRKAHMTGASGGLVYSRDLALFRLALAHADRGKPRWTEGFDDRDPRTFLFPALNHHTDELSCAIGFASLGRLADTIMRRLSFVADFTALLVDEATICFSYGFAPGDSPFFYPVMVDIDRLSVTKRKFAEGVRAEGIDLAPHYNYGVEEWGWLKPHLADDFATPNAREVRARSFNLYLNECYGETEARDAVAAIVKVERYLGRR
jgi:perosamine synthetase